MDRVLFGVVLVAALTGLFGCVYLMAHSHPPAHRYRPAQAWAAVFFGGVLLLDVSLATGDRNPCPWLRHLEPRGSLAELATCWLVVCAAALALHTAVASHRHATRHNSACLGHHVWVRCLLVSALLVGGCAGGTDPFVLAEEANFHAIAPDYAKLVQESSTLTIEQRSRRLRTVQAWRMSLDEKEGNTHGGSTTQR